MNKRFKLNAPTMRKQIEEHSNNLFIMPMDEQQPFWPLLHLLSPRVQEELWAIKHRYSLWKSFVGQYNECIIKWNSRAREERDKEITKKKNDSRARNVVERGN
jgi:hypothetical protein